MTTSAVATAPDAAAAAPPDGDGWRASNLGALLFAATDRCVSDKLAVLRADGFGLVTEAQLALFHHLDLAGARLTVVAGRANLTKQSMIELVDRAEILRLVERRPDPEDGRAKMVHLTADGLLMLASLGRGIAAAEERVSGAFGGPLLREARAKLGAYAGDALGTTPLPGDNGARTPNVARVFAMAARRFSREALAAARTRGDPRVAEVLLALFRTLDRDGGRLTDIAARARMTKQSMSELVARAEALGLVGRRPDPADRRAKLIAFTPAGLAVLDDVRHGLAGAEERFRREAGAAFTARLRARLIGYAAAPRP